jgi:dolichol kinase
MPGLRVIAGSLEAAAALAVLILAASRRADLAGLVASAFLAACSPFALGLTLPGLGFAGLFLAAGGACLAVSLRGGAFLFPADREMKWWRIIARPFALLFIPIDRYLHRTPLLFLLGALALAFAALDLVRLFTRYQLRQLFKRSEIKRFSSMTAFLVAVFIIFLVFPDRLPWLGLGFLTVGDLFGKVVGIRFGRTRLLRGRTLEGTLAFTAGGFFVSWLLYIAPKGEWPALPLYAVLAGPAFAAAVELFSGPLDDNFTTGIISCGFLYSLRYFLRP